MAVAMAVAEARRQTTATAIGKMEEKETKNAPRRQKAPLAEPQGTQVLQRHVAEQVHEVPVVPILATHGGPVGRPEDPWREATCRSRAGCRSAQDLVAIPLLSYGSQ